MKCPKCNSKSEIIDTRPYGDMKKRRRECTECGFRFTTFETYEIKSLDPYDEGWNDAMDTVIKFAKGRKTNE